MTDWVRGAQSSTFSRCLEVRLSFLPPAARYLVAPGSGFAARQLRDELLQAAELIKELRLAEGPVQLQVEGAAGQDERRVAVEALQDVAWRERGPASGVRLDSKHLSRNPELVSSWTEEQEGF